MGKYSKFGEIADRITSVVPHWVTNGVYELKHPRQTVSDYTGDILVQVIGQRLEESKIIEKVTANDSYNNNDPLISIEEWKKTLSRMNRDIDIRTSKGIMREIFQSDVYNDIHKLKLKMLAARQTSEERAKEIRQTQRLVEDEKLIHKYDGMTPLPPPPPLPVAPSPEISKVKQEIVDKIQKSLGYTGSKIYERMEEERKKRERNNNTSTPTPAPTPVPSPSPPPAGDQT